MLLAFVTYFYLTDRPADAHWLEPDERAWLTRPSGRRAAAARSGAQSFGLGGDAQSARLGAGNRLFRLGGLRSTVSASGCRKSSRRSACRMPRPAGSPPFLMRSARPSWSGTAAIPTPRPNARGTPPSALLIAAIGIAASTLTGNPTLDHHRLHHRRLRRVRTTAGILDAADRRVVRYRGGRRHRRDQLDRQSRRLLRALCHGLDQGRDRQLQRRPPADRRRLRSSPWQSCSRSATTRRWNGHPLLR